MSVDHSKKQAMRIRQLFNMISSNKDEVEPDLWFSEFKEIFDKLFERGHSSGIDSIYNYLLVKVAETDEVPFNDLLVQLAAKKMSRKRKIPYVAGDPSRTECILKL